MHERALAVHDGRSARPRLGQRAQPGWQVTRGHVVREREADGGGHLVAPAQRLRGALRHDVPGGDHRDPVGQVFRLVHVMGGEEDGLAELPQPGHDLPGRAAGGRVETGGRLVQEDEFRVADEGEGEIEAAPVAAGEPGAERARLLGEADQGDGLVDISRRAVEPGVHGQALPDGQAGLRLRLLQDHAHAVPPGAARRGRVVPQDPDLSLRARPEAFEDLDRRGLTRAVRAEEGEDLAPPHLQINARHRLAAGVALDQPAHADRRLREHIHCEFAPWFAISRQQRPGRRRAKVSAAP